MQDVKELTRHASPGGRPQPLAFHAGKLWIGSWDTSKLYAVDPTTWVVTGEVTLPGQAYGLTPFDGALFIVVSQGEDDDRYLYRFVPGKGLDEESKMKCPDFTGSHLTTDGTSLYLAQQTFGRVAVLDAHGAVQREFPLPSRAAGICFSGGTLYMIGADDDFDVLEFGTLNIASQTPTFTASSPMAPESRSLAFDGKLWWTNYRELNETVSFTV